MISGCKFQQRQSEAGDYAAVKQQLITLKIDVTAKINDPNRTTINALIDSASAKIQAKL